MATITYHDRQIDARRDENLLQTMERAGILMPCSCCSGICHGCMTQALEGAVPPESQVGLSENQRRLNYFLACRCYPLSDLSITLAGNLATRSTATLVEKEIVSPRVLLARFAADIDWKAGQHVTVWRSEARGRTYSIASSPTDGYVELHVRRRLNGLVSHWLEHELDVGGQCQLSAPAGDCFYSPAMPGQPLMMVGSGTGIAPIYGVLRHALADGHHGAITLYMYASRPEHLYLREQLVALQEEHPGLEVVPVVRSNDAGVEDVTEGEIGEVVASRHPRLRGSLVYLCGSPEMVEQLREQCFLQGAHHADIFCGAFVPGMSAEAGR